MVPRSIYVIDDDALVRSSMSALLSPIGTAVEEFASADNFLQWLPPSPRGVVITDMRMFGMSGLDLLKALSERRSHLPVIVVTAHADVPLTVQLMQEGAITVLEKPYSPEQLRQTVDEALEIEADWAARSGRVRDAEYFLSTLSQGELDVLDLLHEGLLNKEIAARLRVSMRTVENRRSNILKKMDVDSVPELIRKVGLTEQFAE